MNIDALIKNYTTFDELKLFCEVQAKQLQTLTKKNKELQEKVDQLEKGGVVTQLPPNFEVSKEDAKTISEIQLFLLKQAAMTRELNTDEAKRVELYNRILKEANSKSKSEADASELPSGELLKLVE